MPQDRETLEPFLTHLRALPFVREAVLEEVRQEELEPGPRVDGFLRIRTPTDTYRLLLEVKRTNLGYTIANGVIAQAARLPEEAWILFAPYIPKPMGDHLAAGGLNFVDGAGNCRLQLGDRYVALIEGRKRKKPQTGERTMGPATVEVMFAFLAEPALADAPVRDIAERLAVGKTAVADAIGQLTRQGLITKKKPRRILRRKELLERWLIGYETIARPRQVEGRYQTLEADPTALVQNVEGVLHGATIRWGWTGGAAAMKLTGYYRGTDTVVAMERVPADFLKDVRALPAGEGNLTVLIAEGDLAFKGAQQHTVHPLLVFAELCINDNERAREAAEEVRRKYLEDAE